MSEEFKSEHNHFMLCKITEESRISSIDSLAAREAEIQENKRVAIGLDLGMANLRAMLCDANGDVHAICDKDGRATTPSYVAFDDNIGAIVVGEDARKMAQNRHINSIYGIK